MEVLMEARTALITGASQGLGLAIARQLAQEGWSLVIDARRADRLKVATDELGTLATRPARIAAVVGDITDDAHRSVMAAAARSFGNIELVINNASTLGASPLPELTALTAQQLQRLFDVNVVAPVALVTQLHNDLASGATIVNISSDAAIGAYETWGGYGASKAALDHISRTLAAENPQWRVLAVDPGDLRTEMHDDAFPDEDISDRPTPDTVIPAFVRLLTSRAASGRYRLIDITNTWSPTSDAAAR
jgi:NAD(P)-dependent dehydrogenase (short-subunit alcohol dehydrogenase family)